MLKKSLKIDGRTKEAGCVDATVIGNKMQKTVVVRVDRLVKHKITGKYIKRSSKMYAHDEDNSCGPGDMVRIKECRPLSKLKRWFVVRIIKKNEKIEDV